MICGFRVSHEIVCEMEQTVYEMSVLVCEMGEKSCAK